jgi:hypothetical protein
LDGVGWVLEVYWDFIGFVDVLVRLKVGEERSCSLAQYCQLRVGSNCLRVFSRTKFEGRKNQLIDLLLPFRRKTSPLSFHSHSNHSLKFRGQDGNERVLTASLPHFPPASREIGLPLSPKFQLAPQPNFAIHFTISAASNEIRQPTTPPPFRFLQTFKKRKSNLKTCLTNQSGTPDHEPTERVPALGMSECPHVPEDYTGDR